MTLREQNTRNVKVNIIAWDNCYDVIFYIEILMFGDNVHKVTCTLLEQQQ
ncbi:hypothetical protein [Ornithinibacillus halophilus]|nr:hypothetical protein [Ornithinibacillus halophilus]